MTFAALIVVYFGILLLLTKPFGSFMARLFSGERVLLSPVLAPVERVVYRLTAVDARREQGWKSYAVALLLFNAMGLLFVFMLQRAQGGLPFNPEALPGVGGQSAFNTAASFTSNTNWQGYYPETTMSYLTQMSGLAVQNFLSAATGIAVAVALIRGFARRSAREIGNFWVDMTRAVLYILLPISVVVAFVFVAAGVPQTVGAYREIVTVAGDALRVPLGPVASQEAIKILGTNGGGILNANSAHPFENPNAFTNLIQMLLIFLIPAGLTYTFGRMVGNTKQGWAIFAAMSIMFFVGIGVTTVAEQSGNPNLTTAGASQETEIAGAVAPGGNMESVVIGFVETHGRADTEQQIGDLEVVPRRQLTYRGIRTEEMDLDAILERRPQVVLVDELAHTNPLGSEHGRRYQDVEAIRDAGIEVVTTLNIQHIESLQDIVLGITGVQVRETVPDRILDEATDVHLIDLPTEDLLERLEQGKVYPPGRADQAMRNFFRAGNLTALRQLALRRTADEVDERLEGYMRAHDIDAVWPTAERVVVVMDDRVESATVVRHAWRLASALRGELVAVTVMPPEGTADLPVDQRQGIERNLRLVDDLGASVVPIEHGGLEPMLPEELASRIAKICRDENATILVLGHRPQSWWQRVRAPSMVDRVLAQVDGVGVHLVELGNQRVKHRQPLTKS